jgi:hypothetical protein
MIPPRRFLLVRAAFARPEINQSLCAGQEHLAAKLQSDQGITIEPLQLAGLLLEEAAEHIEDRAAGELARSRGKRRASG